MAGQQNIEPSESVNTLDGIADLIDIDTDEAQPELDESELSEEEQEVEETEESEEEQEEAEELIFTVKHDGKDVTLKQSELIEMAQKGFDYTNKTMSLAEERKALEPIKAKVNEVLQSHESALNETLHRLETFASFTESELGQPPSIELAQYDASSYLAQKEAHENKLTKLRNTYSQIQYATQERDRLRQSQLIEQANETEKYLCEQLPGWKDAPEQSLQELNQYIQKYGLSPETTKEAYVQKGFWELAHKAREFDKLQEEKSKLKPIANLRRVIKPSATNRPSNVREQEAWKRYKAKPSLETIAGLI